jgi:phosphatidylserine decarboxylase
VLQAKSSSYTLAELLEEHEAARELEGGVYVTLRLTASMYHRFHAPDDLSVEQVTWVPGALWNVNPPTVRNVPRVYCRNERAIVRTRLAASSAAVTLVAVGAVLVGGICVHAAPEAWDSTCRRRRVHRCAAHLRRGDEMGYFTHGSTIIVLAPDGLEICDVVQPGATIRMGRPLLRDRVRRSLGQG